MQRVPAMLYVTECWQQNVNKEINSMYMIMLHWASEYIKQDMIGSDCIRKSWDNIYYKKKKVETR